MVACVCLTGCKDFLVQEPILSQSTELTLSTYEDLDLAVHAAYAPIASGSWYNSDFIFCNELKTENGMKGYGSPWDSGRSETWYELNYSESSTSSVWSYAYYVISAVNNVMDNLEGKGDEQDLNNLRAECLFLRAFCHFDLVRTFAQPYCYTSDASHLGVPVVLHTDATARPARNTVQEVYDQIIEDLLEAESIIDPSYVRSATDKRATASLEVIQALLARVYLYSQQWSKAAEYATKVIDSGKYTMWTVEDMDASAFDPDSMGSSVSFCFNENIGSGEVIFEAYEALSQSYGGASNENVCGLTNWKIYGDAQATRALYDSYDDADVRKTLFYEATVDGITGLWTLKYGGKGLSSPDVNNIIILRLSDMYLIRAEAIANGASGTTAMNDINEIRRNRGVSEFTQAPTVAQVLEERRLEFAWEAQLWFDLGRTGRDMTRTDYGYNVLTSVAAGSYLWAMPIPLREIQTDENLEQNPGY